MSTTSPTTGKEIELTSLTKKPGDVIKSEEWNRILSELITLREYVNNMGESMTISGLTSYTVSVPELDLDLGDSPLSFGQRAIGLITKQYVLPQPNNLGELCSFGVTDYFDLVQFWAAAGNGDKPTLDVIFEYNDGLTFKVGEKLFINNRVNLSARDPSGANPYLEFLKAPLGIWYKYQLRNKYPAKEVRTIRFVNVNKDCVIHIANILHTRSKIKPIV